MTRPITVRLNGSAESLAAARWAAEEAMRRGLALCLFHALAWPPHHPAPELSEPSPRDEWPDRVLNHARDILAPGYASLSITAEQNEDPPVPALLEAARESEMLSLGSRRFSVGGYLAGSVSLAVVARADRAVVLVRDEAGPLERGSRNEVVVGLDYHHSCQPLIEFAFHSAAARHGLLRVLHVRHPQTRWGSGLCTMNAAEDEAMERTEMEDLSTALIPWREKFPDLPVETHLLVGAPAEHLVRAGAGAAMLVIGRRTGCPARGTRLGATAHSVLHHAPCPVAVVPHE